MRPKYDFSSPGTPLKDSEKLPSELIEGHLHRFFMIQLEALALGLHTPKAVRSYLDGVGYFVSCSCAIHANIATSNIFYKLTSLSDEEMIRVAKSTFNDNK